MPEMGNEVERRRNHVYVKLSKIIKIKSAGQCRSHHQKMLKKYGCVDKIIEEIEQKRKSK